MNLLILCVTLNFKLTQNIPRITLCPPTSTDFLKGVGIPCKRM